MDVSYTHHAQRRMAQRNVSHADVVATLSDPDVRYTDPDGNPIYTRAVGSRRIKVVVAPGGPPHIVITVGD
jgi:hypothetical protein